MGGSRLNLKEAGRADGTLLQRYRKVLARVLAHRVGMQSGWHVHNTPSANTMEGSTLYYVHIF
jgi:hypothetical protein